MQFSFIYNYKYWNICSIIYIPDQIVKFNSESDYQNKKILWQTPNKYLNDLTFRIHYTLLDIEARIFDEELKLIYYEYLYRLHIVVTI